MPPSLDSPYSPQGRCLEFQQSGCKTIQEHLRKEKEWNSTPKYKYTTPDLEFYPLVINMNTSEWKWLSGKDSERGGGGNSLHTASHSVNEAIVAAEGTTDVGECTYSGY